MSNFIRTKIVCGLRNENKFVCFNFSDANFLFFSFCYIIQQINNNCSVNKRFNLILTLNYGANFFYVFKILCEQTFK